MKPLPDGQPPARRPGRPSSQKKHDAILAAARDEFGARGYHGASMDVVANVANVSKRTLYNHFASKEALFRALVEQLLIEIGRTVTIAYDPKKSLREQLRQYALMSLAFTASPSSLQLLRAVLAEHIRDPALVEPAIAAYAEIEYGFAAWVEAACRDARLKAKSTIEASHMFATLMRGIIVWPALLGRSDVTGARQAAAIDEAINMFLTYYAATPKPRPHRAASP